ncbi:hypothetical protein EV356DRAFT_201944 [Viridothelium virens]|uniref:Uncharacterized protein n=1 Tax=Viridothelium virens TaxID=1048519 RepID=A0A6A6H7G6_VIRVR|nr:hypothetical protein EV356DRAFT_201944 [Viridothelium virens]
MEWTVMRSGCQLSIYMSLVEKPITVDGIPEETKAKPASFCKLRRLFHLWGSFNPYGSTKCVVIVVSLAFRAIKEVGTQSYELGPACTSLAGLTFATAVAGVLKTGEESISIAADMRLTELKSSGNNARRKLNESEKR